MSPSAGAAGGGSRPALDLIFELKSVYANWVRMSNSDTPSTPRHRAPVPTGACALAAATEEIGDRWSLLILREAFFGVMRYEDMRVDLGIPRAMLSDRLSRLVERGCLEKRPYREAGARPRSAYALTEKGRGLATALVALTQWSEAFVLGAPGPVEVVDRRSGRPLRVALIDEDGNVVPADEAVPKVRP